MASVQPALSAYLQSEAPLALQAQALEFGKELGVGVFLMFEAAHGGALETLTEQSIAASEAELRADEELRVAEPKDPLDSEDILAVEQAHLMAHLNTRLSETLAFHADAIDVDHVGQVYRSLVVAILALSKAVVAPRGYSPPREGESVD